MTMQQALECAYQFNAYARPRRFPSYIFRYVVNGRDLLIHVFGKDRNGEVRSGPWRTLTKRELEDDWIVCDHNGHEFDPAKPRGISLSQLVKEVFA